MRLYSGRGRFVKSSPKEVGISSVLVAVSKTELGQVGTN